MTDQEKIQLIIDKLFGGKWPPKRAVVVERPIVADPHYALTWRDFDPINHIEDAFQMEEQMEEDIALQVKYGYALLEITEAKFLPYFDMVHASPRQRTDAVVKALEEK